MSRPIAIFSYLKFLRSQRKIYSNGMYVISNYSKDVTSTKDDYLLSDLKNVNSASNVFNIVSRHIPIMNQKHILQAFKTLFDLQKKKRSRVNKSEIVENKNFEQLCQYFKRHIRKIEPNDAIETLKNLSYLGVPGNTVIVQSILQMLKHSINDLPINQIIFLDYLLSKMQRTPLRDALSIALPIVFESQLSYKMDRSNIKEIISCLYYISKKTLSENCTKEIVDALLKCLENDVINGDQAKSILWSIGCMPENQIFEPLILKTVPFLIQDLPTLSFDEIETTVQILLQRYSLEYPFYYSQKLVDAVANYVIENDIGFENGIYCLFRFSKVSHFNDRLLNYVCSKCEKNPDLILNGDRQIVFTLCAAIAETDYRPPVWDTLKKYLYETNCFEDSLPKHFSLIKLCATFCILNIFKRDIFEKCLDQNYIDSILSRSNSSDVKHFLTVLQTISTFKQDYMNLLPPKYYIEQFVEKSPTALDFPLENFLKKALGGDTYVTTDLKTELGHFIDHVVIMRKGGYPVAIMKQEKFLENLEVLPENQIVLILALRPWHYSINCRRIKGRVSQMIKSLEARGYAVIPICLEEWERLADFEKIPFLMQSIKLKVDEVGDISTAVY